MYAFNFSDFDLCMPCKYSPFFGAYFNRFAVFMVKKPYIFTFFCENFPKNSKIKKFRKEIAKVYGYNLKKHEF